MSNAVFVFECLLRDNVFMCSIEDYINNTIITTKTFDTKNVPQLVLILMTLFIKGETYIRVENHIKNDLDLQELLGLFYTYIIGRINKNTYLTDFNLKEFTISYDICARLAVLKLKSSNRFGLGCLGR